MPVFHFFSLSPGHRVRPGKWNSLSPLPPYTGRYLTTQMPPVASDWEFPSCLFSSERTPFSLAMSIISITTGCPFPFLYYTRTVEHFTSHLPFLHNRSRQILASIFFPFFFFSLNVERSVWPPTKGFSLPVPLRTESTGPAPRRLFESKGNAFSNPDFSPPHMWSVRDSHCCLPLFSPCFLFSAIS